MEAPHLIPSDFNGLARMPLVLAREMPVDPVIMMLGTNDLAAAYDRSAEEIAAAAADVAELAGKSTGFATDYEAPAVLLVARRLRSAN